MDLRPAPAPRPTSASLPAAQAPSSAPTSIPVLAPAPTQPSLALALAENRFTNSNYETHGMMLSSSHGGPGQLKFEKQNGKEIHRPQEVMVQR